MHGNEKYKCVKCLQDLPLDEQLYKGQKRGLCMVCLERFLYGERKKKAQRGEIWQRCCACDPTKETRIEHLVMDMLQEFLGMDFEELDQAIGGAVCNLPSRRPDAITAAYRMCTTEDGEDVLQPTVVAVEVDENSHAAQQYTLECEAARMWDITDAIRKQRGENATVWVVRMNPSVTTACDIDLETRVQAVGDAIAHILDAAESRQIGDAITPNVTYAFYSAGGQRHIDHARQSGGVCVVDFDTILLQ